MGIHWNWHVANCLVRVTVLGQWVSCLMTAVYWLVSSMIITAGTTMVVHLPSGSKSLLVTATVPILISITVTRRRHVVSRVVA